MCLDLVQSDDTMKSLVYHLCGNKDFCGTEMEMGEVGEVYGLLDIDEGLKFDIECSSDDKANQSLKAFIVLIVCLYLYM